MSEILFEQALGIAAPWSVEAVEFDRAAKVLRINVDFQRGTRFAVTGSDGLHPVHDTVAKEYRHLNFFQHECYLIVRVPRVKLPDGSVRQVEPPWAGRLSGFTLLFEALLMMLCREMTFNAVAETVGISPHRVLAVCSSYVDGALAIADYSDVKRLAIDETSRRRGHNYVTLVADADARRVLFVAPGRDSATIAAFSEDFRAHQGVQDAIESVSIDMSPAFIKGVQEQMPQAQITFDKFHVIAHASAAVDATRRAEQRNDQQLKGMRWKLLRNRSDLNDADRAELDVLLSRMDTSRTARAWSYREQLQEILQRKQVNVVRTMLLQWATNVMRSKVTAMKAVAKMIRKHIEGIVAWAQTRQTNGFLEAINGLFQAAKRKARGFVRFSTIRIVLFLIAGKLNFVPLNPAIQQQPT